MRKLALIVLAAFFNGCIGVGLYESPELTTSRESTVELGTPILFSYKSTQFVFPYPEILSRYRRGENSETVMRWPTLFFGEGGILAGMSGEYRYLHKDVFLIGYAGIVLGGKSFLLYGGPGIFLRTKDHRNIAGIQLTGGVSNEGYSFPYLYRLYMARRYEGKVGVFQPGIQLVIDKNGNMGTVLEIGFRRKE